MSQEQARAWCGFVLRFAGRAWCRWIRHHIPLQVVLLVVGAAIGGVAAHRLQMDWQPFVVAGLSGIAAAAVVSVAVGLWHLATAPARIWELQKARERVLRQRIQRVRNDFSAALEAERTVKEEEIAELQAKIEESEAVETRAAGSVRLTSDPDFQPGGAEQSAGYVYGRHVELEAIKDTEKVEIRCRAALVPQMVKIEVWEDRLWRPVTELGGVSGGGQVGRFGPVAAHGHKIRVTLFTRDRAERIRVRGIPPAALPADR